MPFHHILGLPKIFNFWEKGVKVRKSQTFEKVGKGTIYDAMADAMDSKSIVGNNVWVQVPPPAPIKN